jgi:chorismate mutase
MQKLLVFLGLLLALSARAQQAAPDSLALFRAQIDSLDQQVIRLLARRMEVVRQVGAYKLRRNLEVVQPARFEAMVRRNVALAAPLGLSEAFIAELMHAIHTESIGIQERLIRAKK